MALPDPEAIEDLELDKDRADRKFRDLNIQMYIDEKLAALPVDAHGLVTAYYSREFGFRTAVIGKIPVGDSMELKWSVLATKPRKGPVDLEVAGSLLF